MTAVVIRTRMEAKEGGGEVQEREFERKGEKGTKIRKIN